MLEDTVAALHSKLDMDIETCTPYCQAANKELTMLLTIVDSVQAKTTTVRKRKKGLSKLI